MNYSVGRTYVKKRLANEKRLKEQSQRTTAGLKKKFVVRRPATRKVERSLSPLSVYIYCCPVVRVNLCIFAEVNQLDKPDLFFLFLYALGASEAVWLLFAFLPNVLQIVTAF